MISLPFHFVKIYFTPIPFCIYVVLRVVGTLIALIALIVFFKTDMYKFPVVIGYFVKLSEFLWRTRSLVRGHNGS